MFPCLINQYANKNNQNKKFPRNSSTHALRSSVRQTGDRQSFKSVHLLMQKPCTAHTQSSTILP